MRNKIFLKLLAFTLGIYSVHSQNDTFYWLDDELGLPQNSVKSIVPDKYGFLWLTTENGLVRYDGQEFKTFNSENNNFSNNRFFYIAGNKESDSLFSSNDGFSELILIQKGKPKKINAKFAYKSPIFVDGLYGLFYAHCIPNVFLDYGKRPVRYYRKDGRFFLVNNNSVSFHTKYGKALWENKLYFENANQLFLLNDNLAYIDKKGIYWECTEEGIKTRQDIATKIPKTAAYFWNASTQQTFVVGNSKIFTLRKTKEGKLNLQLLYYGKDIDTKNVSSFYYDEENYILYCGSPTDGLGKFEVKRFKSYKPNMTNSTSSQIFYSVNELEPNVVITAAGYLIRKDEIIKKYVFTDDRSKIIFDQNKNLWFTNYRSIYCYSAASNYKVNTKVLDTEDDCTALFFDDDTQTMFATVDDRYSNNSVLLTKSTNATFQKKRTIPSRVVQIRRWDKNALILCTNSGLFRYNLQTEKLYKIRNSENLPVRNAVVISPNEVWFFCYGKGFRLLKDNQIYKFPLDDSQSLLTAHTFVLDKYGNFWIPSNKGLFRVLRKDLLDYAAGKKRSVSYFLFKKDSGFYTNEFNGGGFPNSLTTQDGWIWLPSLNGIVSFNPADLQARKSEENIYIEEATVDEKQIVIDGKLYLPRNFERVVIDITTPYFGLRENLILEAQLEESKADLWTRVDANGKISFTKLDPGKHTLIIRKRLTSDSEYQYQKLEIVVEEAFYDTALFQILLAVAILGSLFGIYFVRVIYVRKRNEVLELKIAEKTSKLTDIISSLRETTNTLNEQTKGNKKIIQYITHDLKSPLRFMAMLSRDLMQETPKDPDQLKENLLAIYQSSNQMYGFVENLLDYSKINLSKIENKEHIYVFDLIQSKVNLFNPIALNQKTKIYNHVSKNFTVNGNAILLRIIIHNLLDNALKYSRGKTILFSATTNEVVTVLSIIDTGTGMKTEILQYYRTLIKDYTTRNETLGSGLGLRIVIELMTLLEGKIELSSTQHGTSISLIFTN